MTISVVLRFVGHLNDLTGGINGEGGQQCGQQDLLHSSSFLFGRDAKVEKLLHKRKLFIHFFEFFQNWFADCQLYFLRVQEANHLI